MDAIPFNIEDYFLNNNQPEKKIDPVKKEKNSESVPSATMEQDIETVVKRLEDGCVDITDTYDDWLQVGFALAHELGEKGRIFFHRVSRMNAKYSAMNTDKQFDNCLKTHADATTIKTFFYLAKKNEVDISLKKKR
jgi:hypothetical protein